MDDRPVTVIVTRTQYHIIDKVTPRAVYLAQVLKTQGGINFTVQPGTYKFNEIAGPFGMILSLDPE